MVIMTKQAVLFMDHGEKFHAPNGYIGKCPEWVTKTRQFKEMVNDGMIVATSSTSDKAMDKSSEKSAGRSKKAKDAKEGDQAENQEDAELTEPAGDKAAEQ